MAGQDGYTTISGAADALIVVEKSRFLAFAVRTETEAAAQEFLAAKRKEHYTASHVCYAYIAERGGAAKFSDDGEPQGTAGQPIMDVIKKQGLTDTLVCVARWFGGVKLGAGGLVRAYSAAAAEALKKAGRTEMRLMLVCETELDFAAYKKFGTLKNALNSVDAGRQFGGAVRITEAVLPGELERFKAVISDASAGRAEIRVINERFFECKEPGVK